MSQQVTLSGPRARQTAHALIERAPPFAQVEVKEAKRTDDQNRLMWSLLGYISRAKPQGRVLPPELWKCLFMAACGHPVRFEPSLDGDGVVPLGFKSSRLRKSEMSELIESIYAFGAEHGVAFDELREVA